MANFLFSSTSTAIQAVKLTEPVSTIQMRSAVAWIAGITPAAMDDALTPWQGRQDSAIGGGSHGCPA